MELKGSKDEVISERCQKDRYLREKEEGLTKVYRLEQELRVGVNSVWKLQFLSAKILIHRQHVKN